MEIRGLPIKKKLIEEYLADPDIKKLNFYLLRPSDIESEMYFKSIIKVLDSLNICYQEDVCDSFEEGKERVAKAASNGEITSIIVARPYIIKDREQEIFDLIPTSKDVDMLSTVAAGYLLRGDINYLPATAGAVRSIIEYLNYNLTGKKALVIGRSPSVGMPIFLYLQKKNATVTLAHSRTIKEDIKKAAKDSDVIVLAAGTSILEKEDIKDGSLIIDCGYNAEGKGDLSFAPDNADYTPVPGGVGPVTAITLITNALSLYRQFCSKKN